ncbi:MAG TPA: GTPase domain-containing protein [Pirellulales bacterium]|nr:GTPase domain-containing protein [Pirellulales bacterium]
MSHEMLTHLGLLAEVDSLAGELSTWAEHSPGWPQARHCQALVRRLLARVDTLRVRLDSPLVVATLGGTGTGKSTLVNALVGAEVTSAGRERPTTRQPTLVCRPGLRLAMLGIDPDSVTVIERDAPVLRDLVLLDCPDPDTTEDEALRGTNLARLRELLPHCDVLLVATTQQKYRSARVTEELAGAAAGARLVFVQTHADVDADVREDWQRALAGDYSTGEMFFVDSLTAIAETRQGVKPRGEFGRLVDLLTRELTVAATHRIRRANFLDLVGESLAACQERVASSMAQVEQLEAGIQEQRTRLAARLTERLREELLASRRSWESRLVGEVTSRWGFSPFSCLLRLYQGLGGLVAGAALVRVRSAAQLALWGALEGGRRWRARRNERRGQSATTRAAALGWEESDLRTGAIIIDGYAAEAGLDRRELEPAVLQREAAAVANSFIGDASAQLQAVINRQTGRHCGLFTRAIYEVLFSVMCVALLYRFAKNFFYDSWLAPEWGFATTAQPVLGTDFFLGAALVLGAWSALLLWSFTSRLRRGLSAEINEVAQAWASPKLTAGFFADLSRQCRDIHAWHDELRRLSSQVADLQARLAGPELLGHRVGARGHGRAE